MIADINASDNNFPLVAYVFSSCPPVLHVIIIEIFMLLGGAGSVEFLLIRERQKKFLKINLKCFSCIYYMTILSFHFIYGITEYP